VPSLEVLKRIEDLLKAQSVEQIARCPTTSITSPASAPVPSSGRMIDRHVGEQILEFYVKAGAQTFVKLRMLAAPSTARGLIAREQRTIRGTFLLSGHANTQWYPQWVHVPTESTTLFPRTTRTREQQRRVREARAQTLRASGKAMRELDGPALSRMLSEIADRSVLILGRFTEMRKPILTAIKRALTTPPHKYVPILFDFERPGDRDLIETVLRFAAVSRFVIADLSDPKSVPAELQAIVSPVSLLADCATHQANQREYPVAENILRR